MKHVCMLISVADINAARGAVCQWHTFSADRSEA